MTAPMQQLQLSYDQKEDRLLFICFTTDFCEYRFWITRRFLMILWPILLKLLKEDQKDEILHQSEAKTLAEQIQKEKELRQPTADKLGHKMTHRPMGDQPLLLSKVSAKTGEGGTFKLRLEDLSNRFIEFGGDTKLITAFCQLILDVTKHSDWNLLFSSQ